MSTLISRDPFAREEIHRETVRDWYGRKTTCDWCGGASVSHSGRKRLYRYHIETDGGRKHEISGQFCSIGCCRSYHS